MFFNGLFFIWTNIWLIAKPIWKLPFSWKPIACLCFPPFNYFITCLLQSLMRWVVCCPDSLSTTSRHNWDCFFLSASKQHFAFAGVGKWLCSQPGINPTQHRSLEKPILCRLHDQLFWEHWIYIKGLVALRCIFIWVLCCLFLILGSWPDFSGLYQNPS